MTYISTTPNQHYCLQLFLHPPNTHMLSTYRFRPPPGPSPSFPRSFISIDPSQSTVDNVNHYKKLSEILGVDSPMLIYHRHTEYIHIVMYRSYPTSNEESESILKCVVEHAKLNAGSLIWKEKELYQRLLLPVEDGGFGFSLMQWNHVFELNMPGYIFHRFKTISVDLSKPLHPDTVRFSCPPHVKEVSPVMYEIYTKWKRSMNRSPRKHISPTPKERASRYQHRNKTKDKRKRGKRGGRRGNK